MATFLAHIKVYEGKEKWFYAEIIDVKNKTNMGLGHNRNLAIHNSKNDLVASIDADVVLDKNWLEILIAEIEIKKVVMCGGKMIEKFVKNSAISL